MSAKSLAVALAMAFVIFGACEGIMPPFTRLATWRRYQPRVIVGEPIRVPKNDELVMDYIKSATMDSMKKHSVYMSPKGKRRPVEIFEVPTGESGNDGESTLIAFPMPSFLRGLTKPKKNSVVADSNDPVPSANKFIPTFFKKPPTSWWDDDDDTVIAASSTDKETVQIPKVHDFIVKFFKLRGSRDDSPGNPGDQTGSASSVYEVYDQPASLKNKKPTKPVNLMLQWNLPVMFRRYNK